MPKKSTSNLEYELKRSVSIHDYLQTNKEELASDSLPSLLQTLMTGKNLTKAEVVRESNMNEIYAYQILSGVRRPSRDKLLCICLAMKASLEETQDVLKRSGFAPLYARNQRDSIIMYGLTHEQTILQLNSNLFDNGEEVLE